METNQKVEEKKSSEQVKKIVPTFFEKFPAEVQLFQPEKNITVDSVQVIPQYSHNKEYGSCNEQQKAFCEKIGVDTRIFSNLFECSVIVGNIEYPSTEHYFQMYKYDEGCKNFMALLSSRDVAAFGQRRLVIKQIHLDIIDKLIEDGQKFPVHSKDSSQFKLEDVPQPALQISNWDEVKIQVMYDALMAKFTQNEELQQQLLNTQNTWIIERTKNDLQWADGDTGEGLNYLGKLQMYCREQIRGKQVKINSDFLKAPMNTLIQY